MTRYVFFSMILCAGLATTAPAGAQQVTDAHVQELIRAAAERVGAQTGAPSGAPASGGGVDARPTVALTLDDAVKLALERNLDIAVQRLNPATFDYSVANLRATYRPSLTSQIGHVSNTNPSTQTISGAAAGAGIEQATTTYNGGIAQNIRWGGGAFSANLNNNKQTTTSLTALFNPAFNTNWAAQYTQPLLRNFKIDTTRQQLAVTRLNQDISEIQLQASIINIVSNVRNAYWDLLFATQAVDVAKGSVELAERLVRDNQTRVEIGTMAPIDVVQAQSQAATQRQNLAVAEGTRRTTSCR